MCIFITISFGGTACKAVGETKVKSKTQNHVDGKSSNNEMQEAKAKTGASTAAFKLSCWFIHKQCDLKYQLPVRFHLGFFYFLQIHFHVVTAERAQLLGMTHELEKQLPPFASERPVLAVPQHVTLKPKWYWEELHKHGHVVNPAGTCYHDVTTCFFSLVFCMLGLYFFIIF